jgi:HD-like signal output (HDOD) protein
VQLKRDGSPAVAIGVGFWNRRAPAVSRRRATPPPATARGRGGPFRDSEDGERAVDLSSSFEAAGAVRGAGAVQAQIEALASELRGAEERGFLDAVRRAIDAGELRLPPMPEVLLRVQRLVDSPECDVRALGAEIERDAALATKMVGIANSPFYGALEPVRSVGDAIVRVGLRETRNIATAITLRSRVFRVRGAERQIQALWAHSLKSSLVARELHAAAGLDPDAGFLCGLIHDVGRVALLAIAAARGPSAGAPAAPAMQRIADALHAELGARVAESWHVSADQVEALAWHHAFASAPEAYRRSAAALFAADRLAHALERAPREPDPSTAAPALAALHLDRDDASALLAELCDPLSDL